MSAKQAGRNGRGQGEQDLQDLARRYLDFWQDRVSALAADEGQAESMARLLAGLPALMPLGAPWAAQAMLSWPAAIGQAAWGPQSGGKEAEDGAAQAGRRGQAAGQDRTAAPAAASDGGGRDLERLSRRLAALERRIAELEAGNEGGQPKPKPKSKPKPKAAGSRGGQRKPARRAD